MDGAALSTAEEEEFGGRVGKSEHGYVLVVR